MVCKHSYVLIPAGFDDYSHPTLELLLTPLKDVLEWTVKLLHRRRKTLPSAYHEVAMPLVASVNGAEV